MKLPTASFFPFELVRYFATGYDAVDSRVIDRARAFSRQLVYEHLSLKTRNPAILIPKIDTAS